MSRLSDRMERVNVWIDRHEEKIYWLMLPLAVWMSLADFRDSRESRKHRRRAH